MATFFSVRRGWKRWPTWLFIAAIGATMSGCALEQSREPPVAPRDAVFDELFGLMRERLLLMHEVARWKWNEGKPITDAARERQLLADLEQQGIAHGLDRNRTRAFMAAQIEAAKLIQAADFNTWKKLGQGRFSDARDLKTELRPKLDKLSARMLGQLARMATTTDDIENRATISRRAKSLISGDGIDEEMRRVAIRPLLE